MRSTFRLLATIFTLSMLLSACGGGGSSFGLATGNNTSGASSDSSSSTTTTSSTLALGTGVAGGFTSGAMETAIGSSSLPFGGSTTVSVNIVDTTDNSLSTASNTVTFISNCSAQGKATITSSVTTTNGIATATYDASTCETTDTVTATLSGTTTTATATITIAAQTTGSSSTTLALGTGSGSGFSSGAMTTSVSGSLSFGGSATISVNVVDASDNSLSTASNTVSFTSTCVASGLATIDASTSTSTGTATVTYSGGTCQTSDTITATLSDGTSASTTISIAAQVLGSLSYESSSVPVIAVKGGGTNSVPESTTLKFKVLDNTSSPISGQTVSFSTSTSVGGIALSASSAVTDSTGVASINLNAGTVVASVTVTASVTQGSTSISTTSVAVPIQGGPPDDDSFTIAVSTFNPRGWDYVGSTTSITIRAADRYNNPVPDGTSVSFVTDGGAIDGSCTLSGGTCSATWTSQLPKPTDATGSGIVNILARTTGVESFVDTNGNGLYDTTETISNDLPEAFNDIDLTSGQPNPANYTAGDFFSDFNNNASFDSTGDGFFNGSPSSCSSTAVAAGHCASLVEVRRSAIICMSSTATTTSINSLTTTGGTVSLPAQTITFTPNSAKGAEVATIALNFADVNGNTPATGTSISISAANGAILTGDKVTVPNTCSISGLSHTITITGDGTSSVDTLKITATFPDGTESTTTFIVSD